VLAVLGAVVVSVETGVFGAEVELGLFQVKLPLPHFPVVESYLPLLLHLAQGLADDDAWVRSKV
jgi:hypothetical protein